MENNDNKNKQGKEKSRKPGKYYNKKRRQNNNEETFPSLIVVGVKFSDNGKVYYFDPKDIDFSEGDDVIVETAKGIEFATIAFGNRSVNASAVVNTLIPVIRKATKKDEEQLEKNAENEKKAFAFCRKKIDEHKLDMHLVSVDYSFDGKKIVFCFTSDDRVDFRELVKDLASELHARIELRQIGVRDEARKIGGLSSCGRPCCCSEFMGDFQPVSIKMAKEQNLSLSSTKISGLCGRLMCCLSFENEYYSNIKKLLPKVGSFVKTVDGKVEVVDVNPITENVKCKIELPDGSFDVNTYKLSEIKKIKSDRNKNDEPEEELSDDVKSLLD